MASISFLPRLRDGPQQLHALSLHAVADQPPSHCFSELETQRKGQDVLRTQIQRETALGPQRGTGWGLQIPWDTWKLRLPTGPQGLRLAGVRVPGQRWSLSKFLNLMKPCRSHL